MRIAIGGISHETRTGPTVVLAIAGIDVIVTSNRVQALDAGLFLHGLVGSTLAGVDGRTQSWEE